jgi:hypothetical protein
VWLRTSDAPNRVRSHTKIPIRPCRPSDDGWCAPTFNVRTRRTWVFSFTSLSFYPWETPIATHLIGDRVSPRAHGDSWSTKNIFPLLELNTGLSVCSMSLYRLSHLSFLRPYVIKQINFKAQWLPNAPFVSFSKTTFRSENAFIGFVWLSVFFLFILRRCQHLLLYSAECQDDWWILNCKGFCRKWLWHKLNIISVSAWKDCGKPSAWAEEVLTYPLKLFCRNIRSFLTNTFF